MASHNIPHFGQILHGDVAHDGCSLNKSHDLALVSRQHMRNGLGQDDFEKSISIAMSQGISRFILTPIDGTHTHFEEAKHRCAEGKSETDHRHKNAADGYGTKDNIV